MSTIAYIATVHLLVDAQSADEAADTVSALLTEKGIYEPAAHLIDWSYQKRRPGRYAHPCPIALPNPYDRDTADLSALARLTNDHRR